MTWSYEVTHNEDGTFSVPLPDGDELRIIPPKREWVGLTNEEIETFKQSCHLGNSGYNTCIKRFAIGIEAKLKEKNGG